MTGDIPIGAARVCGELLMPPAIGEMPIGPVRLFGVIEMPPVIGNMATIPVLGDIDAETP